ncbi:MAG TPA: UDP-N-acetylmuramoyl-tripeptide--D-alanyl-D-alanine ligase [Bacteroidetes bacterium]|nr:UDP-N-acetylmuramoyl-tripeptide--D-alanyl-D-alanine ligase [Bacteroidota bacterium]
MHSLQQLYKIYLQHTNVITDSRKVEPGCLFFALKGENFNGNKFAAQAIENGAAYAIIDEADFQQGEQYILVEDVLSTLQKLARHHRQQFPIPVIAITGSNGKTTTKELISAVLSSHYKAHCTKGNFNNHIGVPLTLLAMPPGTEVAVIEMGANHKNEIDLLCRIAEPTHGLITNIGSAHLEGFGSIDGVKEAKSELYHYLASHKGVAFINQDEDFLTELAKGIKWKIFYKKGESPLSDRLPFEVQLISDTPFVKIAFASHKGKYISVNSHLIGAYNFNNIMTAAVLGTYFKVPGQKVKAAIEKYVPANNRSQLLYIGTNTFILDAYNANPTSMGNALSHFSKIAGNKKIAILGAMRELGKYSEGEHRKVLRQALQYGFEKIITVCEEFEVGINDRKIIHFKNAQQLKKWFKKQNFNNAHFLIKGSRSVGLEILMEP